MNYELEESRRLRGEIRKMQGRKRRRWIHCLLPVLFVITFVLIVGAILVLKGLG